jgi:long-chain fatty acid transport protein
MRRAGFAALLTLLATDAGAAGYSLYEQGARALGMAGAFNARADDPSAMFFNPAGLARIQGDAFLVSPTVIVFQSQFAGVAPSPGFGVVEETEKKAFLPVAAYYAHSAGRVAFGLGFYEPYGLEIDWQDPENYTGKFISTHSKITPYSLVPTLALAVSPRLRLGAGANLVWSKVRLERHLPAFDPFLSQVVDVGTVVLESERDFGAGWNAGIQWQPSARVSLGATYRSKVTVDYAGRADFTQQPSGDPAFDPLVAATFPPDQKVTTSIPFPAQGSIGIAYQSCPSWAFEGDFNWTWWNAFDRLDVHFAQTPALDLAVTEDWRSVLNVRVGTEYRKGGTAAWSYRAGYYFDRTPQARASLGPLLPDSDRHGITLGLGHRGGRVAVDAYVLALITPDRSTEGENRDNYNGTYSNRTFLAGASLGVAFP